MLRVASILPITMGVGFIGILLLFRSHGGYKAIVLADEQAAGRDSADGDAASPAEDKPAPPTPPADGDGGGAPA